MPEYKKVLIRLSDLDIAIVQEEAALYDMSFTAALRKIIRDWARNVRPMPAETDEQPTK